MQKKYLGGLVTTRTIEEGGATALLLPFKFTGKGLGLAMGLGVGIPLLNGLFSASDKAAHGPVSYSPIQARMVGGAGPDVPGAMKRAAHGDPEIFAELAAKTLRRNPMMRPDDFGANPEMIAALYNMGGMV